MITREFIAAIRRVDSEDVNVPVRVVLSYDAGTNPLAVLVSFTSSPYEEARVWTVSRELLAKGSKSSEALGEGDVRFRWFPLQGIVLMCMRTPQAHADVALPGPEVHRFIAETHELAESVTPEERTAMLDAFLEEVLGS